MHLVVYNPNKYVPKYDTNRIVRFEDIQRNGCIFQLFSGEEYIYAGNDFVQRIYSCQKIQSSRVIVQLPIQNILKYVKRVGNRRGEVIYERKHADEPLMRVKFMRKHK